MKIAHALTFSSYFIGVVHADLKIASISDIHYINDYDPTVISAWPNICRTGGSEKKAD